MFENLEISYPSYYLVLAVALALLFAVALYFRERKFSETSKLLAAMLSVLRFLGVLGILFLLLNPYIKRNLEEQKDPIIVIAEDRSESISAVVPEASLLKLNQDINELSLGLSSDFNVERLQFGDQVLTERNDSFPAQSTNLSRLLKTVDERYSDLNLGALILVSDGIYNEGRNPLYEKTDFRAPIYTVALGDTTIRKDLTVSNLLHNRIAYLGDNFNIQVDVQAFNSAGDNSKIRVYKLNGDQRTTLFDESFKINNNNFFKTFNFEIEANQAGNVSYLVSLSPISDESSTANNYKRMYMEILDARQKILMLAHAPHPDLAAIKKLITSNKNYELELKMRSDETGNLADYDMVIFHNLPSDEYSVEPILNQLKKKLTPILYIVGSQTSLPRLNVNQQALKITGNNKNQNEAQGLFSSKFSLFNIEDDVKRKVEDFVPLQVPYGEYNLNPKTEVLLYQKIGAVDTRYPLVCFHEQANQKVGIIAGEGLWRWNLYEYAQYQDQETNKLLINKIIQFLSKKDDKRRFRAFTSKNNFKENETIFFDAQLYNQNFELINDPDAFLEIKDASGKNYNFTFSKSNNYYKLDAGRLSEGNYSFYAYTQHGNQKYESSGKFVVQSVQKEQFDLTAKHDILYSLSQRNGGQLLYADQITTLAETIKSNNSIKPVLVTNTITERLLNLKWLAFFIALMLFLEWFLRRFYGHY